MPFNPFASKGIDHPRPFIPKIQVGRRPATFAHSCVLHVPHEAIIRRSLADATRAVRCFDDVRDEPQANDDRFPDGNPASGRLVAGVIKHDQVDRHPLPHLQPDSACTWHICTGTGLGLCHICTGTEPTPATSALGLSPSLPHLHRDRAHPGHICTGTEPTPATSAPGPAAALPGLRAATARAGRVTVFPMPSSLAQTRSVRAAR